MDRPPLPIVDRSPPRSSPAPAAHSPSRQSSVIAPLCPSLVLLCIDPHITPHSSTSTNSLLISRPDGRHRRQQRQHRQWQGRHGGILVVILSGASSGGAASIGAQVLLLSYAYVGIWISLSFSVIVYNKYILDPKMYGWPFPISLTMIDMACCTIVATALDRVLHIVDAPTSSPMSLNLYASSVVPIGTLYALSLWFSNSANIYLSVSFNQMLKALMPIAVYSLAVFLCTDACRRATMLNMLDVSADVIVAAYGGACFDACGVSADIVVAAYDKAHFDARGVALQLAVVVAEAMCLVLIQILLTSKGVKLNPITSLYYIFPCCLVFLAVPWCFVELPRLSAAAAAGTMARPDVVVFGTNCLCAFALNLAVFLLVGKMSAFMCSVTCVMQLITF
ncbi:hypothetical protein QOZ80_2AG0120770 [Eleusine coracana subsp. coracana]|nr:hypothetical protein QOZ80_2AG0120770 [Eleusine coracana subsp. coracana]